MKRILCLLLCVVLLGALVACGGTSSNPTDTAGGTSTNSAAGTNTVSDSAGSSTGATTDAITDATTDATTNGNTGSTTNTSGGTTDNKTNVVTWDPEMEHKVIMDDSGYGILVLDFSKSGDDPKNIKVEDCVIWEWDVRNEPTCVLGKKDPRIDDTKYRYSEYYKKDVIITCGSGGWVGVIDYATGEVLFEDRPGNGPHSVELMPNGDLVLVCSGNNNTESGCVMYYPLSAGVTKSTSKVTLNSAHGVCWDPSQEILWVLGGSEIIGCTVRNPGTAIAQLSKVNGMGASLTAIGHGGGHDLVPAYGKPGKYWVSCSKAILLFDSEKGTLTSSYSYQAAYTGKNIKGIAYFADGTMVITAHDQGGTGTYRSSLLRFVYLGESEGKVTRIVGKQVMIPHRGDSQTYKIRVFTKDYQ